MRLAGHNHFPDPRQVEQEVDHADDRAEIQRRHRGLFGAALPEHAQHEHRRDGRREGHRDFVNGLENRPELIPLGGPQDGQHHDDPGGDPANEDFARIRHVGSEPRDEVH